MLSGLWLLGRVVVLTPGAPPGFVAVVDLSFLPALAFLLAMPLIRAGSVKNFQFLGMLMVLAIANGLMHLESNGPGWFVPRRLPSGLGQTLALSRRLIAPPSMTMAFLLLLFASLVGVGGPLVSPRFALASYLLSGLRWTGAFGFLFAVGLPRKACGGARGRAYAMCGDLMARDPLCSYVSPGYQGAVDVFRGGVGRSRLPLVT